MGKSLSTLTIILFSLLRIINLFLSFTYSLRPYLDDFPQNWRLGVLSTDTVLLFSEPNSQRTMCMLQILNYSWNIRSSSRPCSSLQEMSKRANLSHLCEQGQFFQFRAAGLESQTHISACYYQKPSKWHGGVSCLLLHSQKRVYCGSVLSWESLEQDVLTYFKGRWPLFELG